MVDILHLSLGEPEVSHATKILTDFWEPRHDFYIQLRNAFHVSVIRSFQRQGLILQEPPIFDPFSVNMEKSVKVIFHNSDSAALSDHINTDIFSITDCFQYPKGKINIYSQNSIPELLDRLRSPIGSFAFLVENNDYTIELVASQPIQLFGYTYDIEKKNQKSNICLLGVKLNPQYLNSIMSPQLLTETNFASGFVIQPKRKKNISTKLPLPYIHFPENNHGFISFSKNLEGPRHYCSCMKYAIEECRKLYPDCYIEALPYKEHICHKCRKESPTKTAPNRTYTGIDYGTSTFISNYGWYVNQEYYSFGIHLVADSSKLEIKYDHSACLPELLDLVQKISNYAIEIESAKCRYYDAFATYMNHKSTKNTEQYKTIFKQAERVLSELKNYTNTQLLSKLHRFVEDRVRSQFSYPLIGEKWKHETALYKTVCQIFGEDQVEFHAHPPWLQSLELDVYIPSKQIAFEYQGEQHYRPMEHWGGKKAFKVLKEHDERKKQLCQKNGVTLIEITYLDDITEELVRDKIKSDG